jgi:hypothetical protein
MCLEFLEQSPSWKPNSRSVGQNIPPPFRTPGVYYGLGKGPVFYSRIFQLRGFIRTLHDEYLKLFLTYFFSLKNKRNLMRYPVCLCILLCLSICLCIPMIFDSYEFNEIIYLSVCVLLQIFFLRLMRSPWYLCVHLILVLYAIRFVSTKSKRLVLPRTLCYPKLAILTAAKALRVWHAHLFTYLFVFLSIMVLVAPIVEFRKTISMILSYEPLHGSDRGLIQVGNNFADKRRSFGRYSSLAG